MSWIRWTCFAGRCKHFADACCRTRGQALRFISQDCQSWQGIDVGKLANKSHLGDHCVGRKPFEPGLFHVNILSVGVGRLDDLLASDSRSHQAAAKHPYISYGTHLNPSVFLQLSRGWTLDNDGIKQETFHPKFSPRLFYRETKEYEKTAVHYPQPREEIMVADVQLAEKNASELLDQLVKETIPDEKCVCVLQLLEILHQCSDEFLVRLAGDDRFLKLTEVLYDVCLELRTDEFVRVLTLFARVQIRTSNPVLQMYETECLSRYRDWNVNTCLLVCDALRLIGCQPRVLNDQVFAYIETQLEQLTRCLIVQLIYLIGENRHCKSSLLDALQERILVEIDNLTLTELGSICQGFFKCKTRLRPSLITALCERLQREDLEEIHSFFLIGILKVFREAYFGHRRLFQHIADAITPRLQTFSISAIMHVLLTFSTLHIHSEELLEEGAQVLLRKAQQCRCKDISKFLWSFATLNYHPRNSEHFFKVMITRMIQLLKEYEDFPMFLISGLLALAYLNIYPAELLDIAFSPKFLRRIDEYAKTSGIYPLRDLFLLHTSVKIDCPDYRGSSLDKHFFLTKPSSRIMFGSLPYELSQRPILGEVSSSVASVVGGDHFVKLGFSLPHMKSADIEIHLDSNDTPVSLEHAGITKDPSSSPSLPQRTETSVPLDPSLIARLSGKNRDGQAFPTGNGMSLNTPTRMETANEKLNSAFRMSSREYGHLESRFDAPRTVQNSSCRIVILVWSRNHFHYNGKKLLGLHSMKKRQLMKLGYKTVEIPYFEWANLTESGAREDYVRRKLFSYKTTLTNCA